MARDLEKLQIAERELWQSVGVDVTEHILGVENLGEGKTYNVRAQSAGVGPAVILVHGTMTAGASWASLISDLPDFHCIAIDRPGCGLSDSLEPVERTIEQARLTADNLVVGVLDALELPTAHVIATSMGGWTMFRGAAAHAERHDRLVQFAWSLGASGKTIPLSMRMPTPKLMLRRPPPVTPRILGAMLKTAGMKRAVKSGAFSDKMLRWMAEMIRSTDTMKSDTLSGMRPATIRGEVEELLFTPELLARVTAPTHLFWGDEDPMGDESVARELTDRLPNAELQMAPQAGHAPWLDQPRLAAEAIRTHFT